MFSESERRFNDFGEAKKSHTIKENNVNNYRNIFLNTYIRKGRDRKSLDVESAWNILVPIYLIK